MYTFTHAHHIAARRYSTNTHSTCIHACHRPVCTQPTYMHIQTCHRMATSTHSPTYVHAQGTNINMHATWPHMPPLICIPKHTHMQMQHKCYIHHSVLHICKTLTYAHMYTTFHTCMLTCMYTHTCHMTTCPHQFMFTYMFMHKHHVYVQIQAIRAPTHTCKEYTSTPSHKHIHIQGSASKCEASLTLRPPSRWQCSFYKITSTKRDSQ